MYVCKMASANTDLSKTTCRVCLQCSTDQLMSSIFGLDADLGDIFIYEKIEQCAGIEILSDGNLPSFICDNCVSLLKVAYEFRITCRNSEKFLKEVLSTQEISTEAKHSLEENPLTIKENIAHKSPHDSGTILEFIKNEIIIPPDFEEPVADNIEGYDGNIMGFSINFPNNDENDMASEDNANVCIERLNVDIKKEETNPPRRKKTNECKKKSNVKCYETTKARSTKNSRKGNKKGPHICDICGRKFDRPFCLKSHLKRHLNKKSFNCDVCEYSCHSNMELVRHSRRHTGDKPYKCKYCTRAFGDPSTLAKHERVHRNERPFKCDTCGMSFSYTTVLKRHKVVHTGERPYKCEICEKCFNTCDHLRSHLKTMQHQNDPRVDKLLQNIRRNN